MSGQAAEPRPQKEPEEHPERLVCATPVALLAGSDVVRGFPTQREAFDVADLIGRVHGTRLEVFPAGCGAYRWWAVLPPDPAWRLQVRASGRVHAHPVAIATVRSQP
ncbi:hypothetical protein WDZ16_13080 [Pseudokineococcus marinus]|uniref:Uncharacterized protein n=1 Tax=Pseudokineococcus marinus TaxID=351215 RepID=A0A849BF29_9ACTN|nr:hypothetical protein [Pseudokineococcus marinus]NNH21669.1 hypothetical protein [Pseudokineococcus marinus]